ncbi:hypothetical protein [Thiobacter aerophilum]|uniref:Uncharacterized protein n=1 Tax=Thiobacter aerophilum TaxID=3121275 RepID=A0ABV0EK72_9BURK
MNESRKPSFTVVDGGKEELERKKRLLFNQPWVFDHDEFDRLCELFKLSYSEIEGLIAERIRKRAKDPLEREALLAIINGDHAKFERLNSILEKRKALGIKVISADAQQSLARSS